MKLRSSLYLCSILLTQSIAMAKEGHEHHKMKNHGSKMEKHSKTRKNLDAKTKQQLLDALKINENLHASFFDYKADQVEKNASALSLSLSQIKNPEISKILKYSLSKINRIKAGNDRKINDKNYHSVSMTLIHLIRTYDLGDEYRAYSCPMVKMKWVQNAKKMSKVHNPYAPEMKQCGSQEG